MPVFHTKNFGPVSYCEESVLHFPAGLPGFEERREFLPVQTAEVEPLVFLQSLEDAGLCFITMPVLAVDPGYRLEMTDEDLGRIGWTGGRAPAIGTDVLCLAVLTVKESGPTANLLAPVVVGMESRRAVQAIAPGSRYSLEHSLVPAEVGACS